MRNSSRQHAAGSRQCGFPPLPAARCMLPARAFTVTELLVVIGIIVLALALAVPALNLITGTKSTEAATNQINSLLARARDDAIGLQEMRGVMFYYDQVEDRVNV